MKELGITKGECKVIASDNYSNRLLVSPTPTFGENNNNAKLYTDAHKIAQKTNLLPSELLERYNEAIEVLETIKQSCDEGEIELIVAQYMAIKQTISKANNNGKLFFESSRFIVRKANKKEIEVYDANPDNVIAVNFKTNEILIRDMKTIKIEPCVIGVDFDGTCVAHDFPFIGKNIGAQPVLYELVKAGHKLVLFTMRSNSENHNGANDEVPEVHKGPFLEKAIEWFKEHNIPLYGVNKNPTQDKWTTSPKAYCHLYIDDAALGIPLKEDFSISSRKFVDWRKVRMILKENGYI
jgi:hypothetical protein